MDQSEARGVKQLHTLLEGVARRSDREDVRRYVDGLEDAELADVMGVISAADIATGETGNLFLESAAARLRGLNVEAAGSAPEPTPPKRLHRKKPLSEDQLMRSIFGDDYDAVEAGPELRRSHGHKEHA